MLPQIFIKSTKIATVLIVEWRFLTRVTTVPGMLPGICHAQPGWQVTSDQGINHTGDTSGISIRALTFVKSSWPELSLFSAHSVHPTSYKYIAVIIIILMNLWRELWIMIILSYRPIRRLGVYTIKSLVHSDIYGYSNTEHVLKIQHDTRTATGKLI